MIARKEFERVVAALGTVGQADIHWAESIVAPTDPDAFASEIIFVICNSGMKNTVARKIYGMITKALSAGESASTVFGHVGKSAAIDRVWRERGQLFTEYRDAGDKIEFLAKLPWIGNITKWHLAKNFGVDVAKPDVHLQRLADHHGTTPQSLCEALAKETGYRVATIDTVLWRACANGVINSKTGEIAAL